MRCHAFLAGFCLFGFGLGEVDSSISTSEVARSNSNLNSMIEFGAEGELEILDLNESEQYLPIVRQGSCENMTLLDIATITAHYPYIRVRCEAEKTMLLPKFVSVTGGKSIVDSIRARKQKSFTFIERLLELQEQQIYARYPLSPCVRPSSMGSGLIEAIVTLNTLAKRMKEITGKVPIIEIQAGKAQYFSRGSELVLSATCIYENEAVRPVLEILTLIITISTREWVVTPNDYYFKTEKSNWKNIKVTKLSESNGTISCLSEKFAPNVCLWTEEDAFDEITKYLKATTTEPEIEKKRN